MTNKCLHFQMLSRPHRLYPPPHPVHTVLTPSLGVRMTRAWWMMVEEVSMVGELYSSELPGMMNLYSTLVIR